MEHTSTVIDLVSAITALLLVAAAVLALSKRLHLPFTVMLVVAGIGLSEWAQWSPGILSPLVEFQISPDVILFVFLPTLIFESSLHLDARELRRNLLPVLTLAIPGLLISTAIIGTLVAYSTPIDFGAAAALADDKISLAVQHHAFSQPLLAGLVKLRELFGDRVEFLARALSPAVEAGGAAGVVR